MIGPAPRCTRYRDNFARLDRTTRQLGYVPEFLLTHPLSSSRLSDLERRVSDAKRDLKPVAPDFRLLQMRLQMAYSDQLDENIRAFESALQDGEAPVATRYGLSLAYLRQSRLDEALSTLAPLLKADPNRLEYRSTEIDIAMARRDYAQALALSQSIWSIYPGQRSILEPYTRAALALNQASRVRPLLDKAVRDHANDTAVWRLLADCAAQQKDAMAVFRARAEILYLSDREKLAEEQLKNALRLAANNAEQEEAVDELDIDYGGDSIEIGFNVTYLIDALSNMGQDMVTLEFSDGNSSALLTIPDNATFKYVVMPMRI